MPWFRVDDGFALHPKALAAGNAAVGLWVRAGSWSAQQLTEGFVPAAVVAVLGGKPKDAQALVTAGLWLEAEGGYRFHQWDERQPTKESVEADREAARERQRNARQRAREARESQRSSPDVTRDEPVTHADVTPGVTVPPSLPVPSLPSELLQPPPTSEVAATTELALIPPAGPPATTALTTNQRAQALARRYVDLVPMSRFPAVLGIAKRAIEAGHPDPDIAAALERIAKEGRSLTVETLRVELEGQPPPKNGRRSVTERATAGLALAHRLAQQETP